MRPHAQNNPYTDLNLFAAQMRGGWVAASEGGHGEEGGKAPTLFRARGLLKLPLKITCSDRPGFCRARAGDPHWSAEVHLAPAAAALHAALAAAEAVEPVAQAARHLAAVRAGYSPATAAKPAEAVWTGFPPGAGVAGAPSRR